MLAALLITAGCGASQPAYDPVADRKEEPGASPGAAPAASGVEKVDLPLDFPTYPGAKLIDQWELPGASTFQIFVFASDAELEQIRSFFLKELREAGWYVFATSFSQFSQADRATDLVVSDARAQTVAIIVVEKWNSDQEQDGYSIQFAAGSTEPQRVTARTGADLKVEHHRDFPVFPGAYLTDYTHWAEVGQTRFTYRAEVEVVDTDILGAMDFYRGELTAAGWEITLDLPVMGAYRLEASDGKRRAEITFDTWVGGAQIEIMIEG